MDQVHVVRHKVLVEGRSQRAVARELGLARVAAPCPHIVRRVLVVGLTDEREVSQLDNDEWAAFPVSHGA